MTTESVWENCSNRVQILCGRLEEMEEFLAASDRDEKAWKDWAENRKKDAVGTDGSDLAARLSILSRDFYYLIRILQKKSYLIAIACRDSINSRNALILAYSARGLFEHVGALALCQSNLDKACNGLKNQGDRKKVDLVLGKSEEFCKKSYYGSSMPNQKYKPHHTNDFVDALEDSIRDASEVYDFLCQYVHPNHGSNRIVSGGTLGESALVADPDEEQRLVTSLTRIVTTFAEVAEDYRITMTSGLIQLDSWSKYAAKGMKLARVFAVREAAPSGDGTSMESAISFPKARNHAEEMQMLYRYLEKLGLQLLLSEVIIENGGFFDKIKTQNGVLWIRYKFTSLEDL